jgi:catechol 2,3-dioxygenase-like lactoylglutathione lyase family enzyme
MLNDYPVYATIATKDLAKARTFYEETLGLKAEREQPDGILYQAGMGTKIFVYPSEFAGTAQSTLASWMVDDLDSTVDELGRQGITFEQYDFPGLKTDEKGIAALGEIRGAWFKDPDGNILNIGTMPPA